MVEVEFLKMVPGYGYFVGDKGNMSKEDFEKYSKLGHVKEVIKKKTRTKKS